MNNPNGPVRRTFVPSGDRGPDAFGYHAVGDTGAVGGDENGRLKSPSVQTDGRDSGGAIEGFSIMASFLYANKQES